MAYKKTKAVTAIEEAVDKYLEGMRFAGKTPNKIYLTSKQYQIILDDKNKAALDANKNAKTITKLDQFKGYPVAIYNA